MGRTRLAVTLMVMTISLAACGGASMAQRGSRPPPSHGRLHAASTPTTTRPDRHPAPSASSSTSTTSTVALPNTPADPSTSTTTTTTTTTPVPASGDPSAGDMDAGPGVIHYVVGQTGTLWDPTESVPLATITVWAPTFSTTDSSGDTPQYGYFATFTVTIGDIAPASTDDDIPPDSDDFYVDAPDGLMYGNGWQANLQEGNGYWAALPNDLGNGPTQPADLFPGQTDTGTVTIDVPSEHGQLVYDGSYDGQDDGSWSF
jgi:hypothetical protein